MDPQFVMCFAVATGRPVPLMSEVRARPDGSLELPGKAEGRVLSIGAASSFYDIPAKDLRMEWIRAAVLNRRLDGAAAARWGITPDEWAEARKHRPKLQLV